MHVPTIERPEPEKNTDAAGAGLPPGRIERLEAIEAPLAGAVLKGTLLTLLTLGIYRFWYRTILRRYYWGHTRLAGDAFEYTGTGKELFIGFLIALAIVLPIYLVVTLIGLYGGALLGPTIAGLIGAIVMPAVVQILSYRARRYRLVRTRYRGIRFHQTGTGTGYLLHTVKWLILASITFGIVLPYLRRALERYKTENTWFGNAQGAFYAPVKPLMRAWLVLWGTVAALIPLAILLPFLAAFSIGAASVLGLLFGVMILAMPFLWVRYRVREFRTFVSGTRLGEITLESDLSTGDVIWTWVKFYLVMLGLGLVVLVAGALVANLLGAGVDPEAMAMILQEPSGAVFTVVGFLVFVFGGALVTEIVLRRRLWALRARSVIVTNIGALETVVQTAGQDATGIGEAFDTGFDVAG